MSIKTAVSWGICCLVLSMFPGCGKNHVRVIAAKQSTIPKTQLIPFVPPVDSAISRAQMTAWFNCNHALDSLSALFTTSLSTNKDALPDSVFKYFSGVQDRICAEKGLTGGYCEYRWIMENLGSAKNKALYDSVKTAAK